LQDWLMPPDVPMMWRVQKRIAGSGSLGDLMAHSIDLALWLLGDIDSIACTMKTFIKKRPKLDAVDTGLGGKAKRGAPMGTVDVDDGVVTLAKFKNGALGTFEATRYAAGHKNYNWFEVNGSKGSIIFNLERMNELEYYDCADPADRVGFRLIQATADDHPFMATEAGPRFWPVAHIIGYEHTFINTVFDLCNAIATGKPVEPNFEDAVKTQAVLDACDRANKENAWVRVRK
jgi:predicted dehydrogenase